MSDTLRSMGKSKNLINLLYVLIATFILLVLSILAPGIFDEVRGNMFAFALFGLGGTFMVLGFVIAILAKKHIKDTKLKKFLMLAGFSAGSFLILTVIHN
ncbi:MAG: hypothetical protein U9Q67_03975, partial [Patescibacteria group bacterium]|nr:hypothetical protein [Patescibacteria group bacterium]